MRISSAMRCVDDERTLVRDIGVASWLALRGAVRLDGPAGEMISRPGPWGRRSSYPVGEVIRGLFVVDPPSVKIWPRILSGSFHSKSALCQHVDGVLKLLKLKLDRLFWFWIEIDLPTNR